MPGTPAPSYLATFTEDRECAWCGGKPTIRVLIRPPEVTAKQMVKAAVYTYACRHCSSRLSLHPLHNSPVAEQIADRAVALAAARKESRDAMKAGQGSLFPDERVVTTPFKDV